MEDDGGFPANRGVGASRALDAADHHPYNGGNGSNHNNNSSSGGGGSRKLVGVVGREHPLYGIAGAEKFPEPRPLSARDRDAYADVLTCFGEYLTRCLRDRGSWQLRAAALRKIREAFVRQEDLHPKMVPALKQARRDVTWCFGVWVVVVVMKPAPAQ